MLTVLDWFILVMLLAGLIRGYLVGAVRQAASLLGLVAALLFSVEFMGAVGALIVKSLGLAESVAPLAGFTVLFLGVYLLFLVLARLLEQLFDTLSLSFLNRAAGGAVGGAKAALLLSLLFLVLAGLELPEKETRTDSALYRPVAQLLPRTIEATESWFPAAKRAADQLGRQVRSRMDAVPESSDSGNARSGLQSGIQ
ncbi:membrane protein required for colicin V production [Salinibacter ruber]|jgi:membrane protein required for colicin V production|nr:CvpA family protein [Salinibacter ruber]MBB4060026.1 membrane protein required for colicin V production [Salinibacter ruber]MBB4069736.1 membrane protein required for colicin V production [Salinibacter ruber]MBB4089274.1 membrane protein required for colicin V production [Salinibacter ruber]MCS3612086.1 membrane protein required for colicin V production [Salinibacter ruber]MCS3615617.1 membrane protein required for colicin V production [Salinibacter ruber]